MANEMVAVLVPKELLERLEAKWEQMLERDQAALAIRPRRSSTAAVRIALHLIASDLESYDAEGSEEDGEQSEG